MKRTIAIVVALLAVGVVAGAFLLPSVDHDDHRDLQAAMERTLAASSYRLTESADGKATAVEDYIAPDRLRTTPHIAGGPHVVSIIVGRTSYLAWSCDSQGASVSGYTANPLPTTTRSVNAGSQLSVLFARATDVRSESSAGITTFTFTPTRLVSRSPKLVVQLSDGVARVQHSRLRSVEFTERIRLSGSTRTVRARAVFSRYGAVDPIEAPPADQILPEHDPCGTGVEILTPGASNG